MSTRIARRMMVAALATLALASQGCAVMRWAHLAHAPASPATPVAERAGRSHAPKPGKAVAANTGKRKHAKVRTAAPKTATPAAAEAVETPDPAKLRREALKAAEHQIGAGQLADAESSLVQLVAEEPRDPRAQADLSRIDFVRGRHQEAIQRLEPLLAPESGLSRDERDVLLAGVALHWDALGRTDRAAAALSGVSGADLDRVGSALACVRLRGEHPDSADAVAEAALHADRSRAANWNNWGVTRLRAGDLEGARKAFLEAIDRDPQRPGPYYNLAILEKFYLFHDAEGAAWFRRFRERSNDDPDGLARAFADAGAPAAADAGGER